MARSLALPTLGVLALAGGGLGVHLGRASIAEINPAYFSSPPTRFHADLSPYRTNGSGALPGNGGAGSLALGAECVGCRTYPEEYHPIHDPAVDGYDTAYAAREEAVAFAEDQPARESRLRDPDLARVALYVSFRVSAEEAEAGASAEADEAPVAQREEVAVD
ncbi:MAG: hypothetical protein M3Q08_06255 [Pseudomonadota bacterium]|nr:hypothetical protein [Pseudomonadota bacterium]